MSSYGRRYDLGGNLRLLPRAGSSSSMIENNSSLLQTNDNSERRRPGSDSDILETRGARNESQGSLMLAYHQRPSVVANHSAMSDTNNVSNVPHRQTKPVFIWSQMEVCKWLKRQIPSAQAAYADMFAKHDITGKTLLALNDEKLQKVGIADDEHRQNILNEILKLQMKNYMQCFKGLQAAGMFELP